MFACTVLCLPIGYVQSLVAELSKLSFSSPELLAHAVGCSSNPTKGSCSSTFILSLQIRNSTTPHPYHHGCDCAQLPHHGKKCCTT